MNVYGQLLRAQLEVRTSDHVGTIPGMVWFHNTEKRIKFSEGTNVVSLLANDQKAIFGTNGTAANNIRFNRSGNETLQLVLGSDTTAEGTVSANAAQIDARAANYSDAGRPAFGNKGRLIYNTDDDQIQVDDGTQWTGVGGGGGGEIPNVMLGEDIPAGRAVFLWIKPTIVIDATNDWLDVNTGAGQVSFQVPQGTYLYDTDANRAELHLAIKTAFEASAATGTLTVTFNTSTRKITLATSASTTWLWNTGTHGQTGTDTHLGTTLGFLDSADSSSSTSTTADNEIDGTLSKLEFMYQTDADYTHKSKGYRGFLLTAGSKYDLRALKFGVEGTVFPTTGKSIGDELYTAKAGIEIVTGTNDDIDFNDGTDRVATLDAGYYPHPYEGLVADIKAKLDGTASAIVFTCSYDNDTDKFTIGGDSAFVLENNTGPNVATSAMPTLGYSAAADTASLTSHVADNSIAKKGQLFRGTDPLVNSNSSYGGFARNPVSTVHAERNPGDVYIPVVNDAGGWLANPVSESFANDAAIGDVVEHSSGRALRTVVEDTKNAAPFGVHKVQYRLSASGPWITSASGLGNYGANISGTDGKYSETNDGNNVKYISQVRFAENGLDAVLINKQLIGPNWRIYAYYSTDGGVTWTQSTGPSTGGSIRDATTAFYHKLVIRENKAVIYTQNDTSTSMQISISDDVGSGFATFGALVGIPGGGQQQYVYYPSQLFIQYFPAETGANKHRIILFCFGTTRENIHYWKGDGSAHAFLQPAIWSTTRYSSVCGGIEQIGNGNRIFVLASVPDNVGAGVGAGPGYTNDDYNAGVLTFTDSTTDFTGGLVNVSDRDVMPTDNTTQQQFTESFRGVIINGRGYAVMTFGATAGNATPHVYLMKSVDVTTNTWTLEGQLDGGTAASCVSIAYIPSKNILVTAWKEFTTTANHITEGQVWARTIDIDGNNVSLRAAQQIDGGAIMSGFEGWVKVAANADTATVTWLSGATNSTIKGNTFA